MLSFLDHSLKLKSSFRRVLAAHSQKLFALIPLDRALIFKFSLRLDSRNCEKPVEMIFIFNNSHWLLYAFIFVVVEA